MKLRGQSENGYAMAVLLVVMSVMAIMMTAAMPVWKQLAQREKEQELIFEGSNTSVRSDSSERKYANTPPPTLDVLVRAFPPQKCKTPSPLRTSSRFLQPPLKHRRGKTRRPGSRLV
jgi:type II secretory pathway pseudopilin PulG